MASRSTIGMNTPKTLSGGSSAATVDSPATAFSLLAASSPAATISRMGRSMYAHSEPPKYGVNCDSFSQITWRSAEVG